MMKGARPRSLDVFLEVSEVVLEDLSRSSTPEQSQPDHLHAMNLSSPQVPLTRQMGRLVYDLKAHAA